MYLIKADERDRGMSSPPTQAQSHAALPATAHARHSLSLFSQPASGELLPFPGQSAWFVDVYPTHASAEQPLL